jgi:hypothetical protein
MAAQQTDAILRQAAAFRAAQLALVAVVFFDGQATAVLGAALAGAGAEIAELAVAIAVDQAFAAVGGAFAFARAVRGAAAALWVTAHTFMAD